jgi:hypothetical protein
MRVATAPAASLALLLASLGGGCGGGDSSKAPTPAPAAPAPTMAQVIAAARHNAGFAGCKRVAPGAVQPPTVPAEPRIQAILCDGLMVGNVFVYRDAATAERRIGLLSQDRPFLVNRETVVTTGAALLAKTYDAKGALTLPAELKSACGCGEVRGAR